MKKYSYLLLGALLLTLAGVPPSSYAISSPSRVVYNPGDLQAAYQVDLRDISQTARYADQILVVGELPYTLFNVMEALQGRVAGVRVFNRGWNYYAVMRGWQRPLYVIDGLPVDAHAVNTLNPNDVMTIEVHQGLGASLFGGRGSGGALVFNTRRG